jgi:drug/metabolite transporter (DMT)-like permease
MKKIVGYAFIIVIILAGLLLFLFTREAQKQGNITASNAGIMYAVLPMLGFFLSWGLTSALNRFWGGRSRN